MIILRDIEEMEDVEVLNLLRQVQEEKSVKGKRASDGHSGKGHKYFSWLCDTEKFLKEYLGLT